MSTQPTEQDYKKNRNRWVLLFILLPILGFVLLGALLFFQSVTNSQTPEFIPVELHSDLEANYQISPRPTPVPGVRMDIIWDAIYDREPGAANLEERQAEMENKLLTPVPTVTPSLSACQGIHFIYASQDTWVDSVNPDAVYGTDPLLQLGRQGDHLKSLLLYFPVNKTLSQNTLIHSARLEMDVERMTGSTTPNSLAFFNLRTAFGELDTNWSNQPNPNIQYETIELAASDINLWDVTDIVRDWLSGRHPNKGLVIEPQSTADLNFVYYSREIINQPNPNPNTMSIPVGPRLIINCGGILPQAVAVNLNTPTPAGVKPPPPSQQPPDSETPAVLPSAPIPPPATQVPPVAPTIAKPLPIPTNPAPLPTPSLPTPLPTLTRAPPTPTLPPTPLPSTNTPVPPPDDNGDDPPPPPPPPTDADLALTKNASSNLVTAGTTLTYTLNVNNNGPANATNVIINDTLPTGVSLVFAAASQGVGCNGVNPVLCNLGTIGAGGNAAVTIIVRVSSAITRVLGRPDAQLPNRPGLPIITAVITNSATVSANEPDPISGNNSDTITTTVNTAADLTITKSDNPDPVTAGETLTYTLSIANNGPSPAQNLVITDNLPANVAINSGSVLTGNRVLLMHLDENPATDTSAIADSSGNSNNGVLTTNDGAANKSVGGQFDQAISFDGTDDYILIPRPITDDFTISFWFSSTQVVGGSTTQWWQGRGLVDGEVVGNFDDFGVSLGSGGRVHFGVGFGPDVTITSPGATPLNDGQWHHVAATRDGTTGAMILYVDGVQASSGAGSTNSRTASPNLRIGSLQSGVAGRFFNGLIDEVTVFDRTLSAGEVVALASPYGLCTDSNPVTCQVKTLAAGDSITFTISVNVNSAFSGVLTNTAAVTSATFDPILINNTAVETASVPAILTTLSITNVTISEGDSGLKNAVFTVTLSAISAQTATVYYATSDNTALAGSDYLTAGGTLTFSPGITQQMLTVPVINDLTVEGNESFFVNLSTPGNATIADGQGVGTIIDDDSMETLCATPVTTLTAIADTYIEDGGGAAPTTNHGTEGNLRTRPRVGGNQQKTLIQFDLSAIPPNSAILCATLLVYQEASANTGQRINVHRVTAAWVEGNGPVTDTTGATWNQSDKFVASNWGTAGGDFAPTIEASFVPSATNHVVNVTSLAQFWTDNSSANYGLLFAPQDIGSNNSISFASRESAANPQPRLAIEYIPGLVITDVTVTEGNTGTTTAIFSVTLSAASAQTITVNYATANNTATTANNDYITATGTLTFPPASTVQTFTVTINGDLNHEADETFLVNLSNPANAGIIDGQGVGAILNDEVGGMALPDGNKQIHLPVILKSTPKN